MFNKICDTYEPRCGARTRVNATWPSWPTCFVSDVVQEDTEVTDPDEGQVDTEEDSYLEEALDESQTFFSELEGKSRKPKASET